MLIKDDNTVINMLFKLAQSVPKVGHGRLASCIVYKGQVVAWGFNQRKSHPFQARFGKNADSIYLHSETDAIKNALRVLDEHQFARSTLYVARAKLAASNSDRWIMGLAKPCEGCMRAIVTFDIGRVVWSTDDQGIDLVDRR